jgi:purine nucleoside permease
VTLPDNPGLVKARASYAAQGGVQAPPLVMLGDTLATVRFWHGMKRTQWARNWVNAWTQGDGHFVMSACEDQGILDVLTLYGADHKVDARRVLVLRGGSNFTEEPLGSRRCSTISRRAGLLRLTIGLSHGGAGGEGAGLRLGPVSRSSA